MIAQFAAWWSWLRAATVAAAAWWPWFLAGTASIMAFYGAWWLWWRLPKRQADRLRFAIRDPKARADVEDNFRKTIGQLLGGAAVLIGAAFAYVQFTTQRQEFEVQQKASRDLLISNQVAKGFELLGNKDNQIQQRLGGIYALEGVMNTSKEYHKPVLEALSAFVRDGTRTETGDGPPATDIQAALTVIGRRAAWRGRSPNLANAHIPKADLGGANLSRAVLTGANLSHASLIDADLSYANLDGANLSYANLSYANLYGADLIDADLSYAYLNDAHLGGTNLYGVKLSSAHLGGADLSNSNVSQTQLDQACCGTDVKLDPGLTIKP